MIQIRQATTQDEARLLRFLDAHYLEGHAFVRHPELMRWQHLDPTDSDLLTIVLAERGGEILGILGYVPSTRFDPRPLRAEVALAIWQIRSDVQMPGLGLQLLNQVKRLENPVLVYGVALSDMVIPIYRALGYETGTMDHFALFPDSGGDGPAEGVPTLARRKVPGDGRIVVADEPLFCPQNHAAPCKSLSHVGGRYVRHPWYRYKFAHVEDELILVWRIVESPRGSVIRVVDMLGDSSLLSRCAPALRHMTLEHDCAYMDLVSTGLAAIELEGWVSRSGYPNMILPNHFEPFVPRNFDIRFAVKSAPGVPPVRLLRGDADQDRPNRL